MKSVKKIFVAFFALFVGIMLVSATTKAKAYPEEGLPTPWTLSFDNGQSINLVTGYNDSVRIKANSISITYNDLTGETTGSHYTLHRESIGVIPYEPYVENQYISNGETQTFDIGGHLIFEYSQYDENFELKEYIRITVVVDRSILHSNRISTSLNTNQYYYENGVNFSDSDYNRDPDMDLVFEVKNLTSGVYREEYKFAYIYDEGEYEVTVHDKRKNERKMYKFAVDKTAPLIYLVECDWQEETPMSNGAITSAGMKVIYGDNFEVKEMTYEYRPFSGGYEKGTVKSGFTFYRKGEYKIIVTDMLDHKTIYTFTITDYDLVVDPEGAGTVGTEVTRHGGAYGGTTLSVGYSRCIYLGPTAPSQSRFDYTFTSSNESIATVSAYGTVEAKGAGTVVITCVNKKNPSKVSKIVFTVLP